MTRAMKKVLIVVPPVRLSQPPTRFPLGLAYVAASLEQENHEVSVLDLNVLRLTPEEEEVALRAALRDIDVVCTGGMITMLLAVGRIARIVKESRPDIPVLVGGPMASHNQELILNKFPIDLLVRGEGEHVVCRILEALGNRNKLSAIPGLVYLSDGNAVFTPAPTRIKNIDGLPFPAYHLFPFSKYIQNRGNPRSTDIITSRGCPYCCSFCFQNFGHEVYFRSVSSVMEEIRFLVSTYGVQHFYIEDEFFIQRRDYIQDFCREIRKLNVTWGASTRVNTLSSVLLSQLKDSGCKMLMIGIESFDDAILKEINKQVTVSQIDQACSWLADSGIEISPGLIIGMPGETRQSIKRTVDGCIKHKIAISEWTYAFATPYPGTQLYQDSVRRGLIRDEWEYILKLCEVGDTCHMTINMTAFTDAELIALRDDAIRQINASITKSKFIFPSSARMRRALGRLLRRLINPTPFAAICKEHFRDDLHDNEKRSLFRASVAMVEIETFSYCNRKCWFCTNTVVDRKSQNVFLPDEIYRRVIGQLAMIGYDKMISFSRYNEPLADDVIFERLRYAHRQLPLAVLHLNTNGDYLDVQMLFRLYSAGLSSLNIQVYLPTADYSDDLASAHLARRIQSLALPSRLTLHRPGQWIEYSLAFLDMKIRIYARNFNINGCDRGGMIKSLSANADRTSPCLQPFVNVYLDYNGNCMPCCNLRSDIQEHAAFAVGNIQTSEGNDIFSLFSSPMLSNMRKGLIGFNTKEYPCNSCRFDLVSNNPLNKISSWLISRRLR